MATPVLLFDYFPLEQIDDCGEERFEFSFDFYDGVKARSPPVIGLFKMKKFPIVILLAIALPVLCSHSPSFNDDKRAFESIIRGLVKYGDLREYCLNDYAAFQYSMAKDLLVKPEGLFVDAFYRNLGTLHQQCSSDMIGPLFYDLSIIDIRDALCEKTEDPTGLIASFNTRHPELASSWTSTLNHVETGWHAVIAAYQVAGKLDIHLHTQPPYFQFIALKTVLPCEKVIALYSPIVAPGHLADCVKLLGQVDVFDIDFATIWLNNIKEHYCINCLSGLRQEFKLRLSSFYSLFSCFLNHHSLSMVDNPDYVSLRWKLSQMYEFAVVRNQRELVDLLKSVIPLPVSSIAVEQAEPNPKEAEPHSVFSVMDIVARIQYEVTLLGPHDISTFNLVCKSWKNLIVDSEVLFLNIGLASKFLSIMLSSSGTPNWTKFGRTLDGCRCLVIELIAHHPTIFDSVSCVCEESLSSCCYAYCSSSNPKSSFEVYKDAYAVIFTVFEAPQAHLPLDYKVVEFGKWMAERQFFRKIQICPTGMLEYLEKLHESGILESVGESILEHYESSPNSGHLKFLVSARLWLNLPVNLPKEWIDKHIFHWNMSVAGYHLPRIFKQDFPKCSKGFLSQGFFDVLGHLIFTSLVKNDGLIMYHATNHFPIESLFKYVLMHRSEAWVTKNLEKVLSIVGKAALAEDVDFRELIRELSAFNDGAEMLRIDQ